MKIFVTNVFYDEQTRNSDKPTKYIRIDPETGEEIEVTQEELIMRKSGTVILLAEGSSDVLDILRQKVTDKIVEVEIIDEIETEEEIQTVGVMAVSGEETESFKGKIIFQSNI